MHRSDATSNRHRALYLPWPSVPGIVKLTGKLVSVAPQRGSRACAVEERQLKNVEEPEPPP